ncbi:hypothetical protein LJB42_003609 [Komagataella kurtzmanii]|nr:hypothetical protein LJB42_003609 [Komagataella kurtzmanii]
MFPPTLLELKANKPTTMMLASPPSLIPQQGIEKAKPKSVNLQLNKLKYKKAWELAYSPAKNIPMNLIMMYFSPNSLQIISIMMTINLFTTPLKDIFNCNEIFEKSVDLSVIDTYDLIMMKMFFIVCHFGTLLVGMWKLNNMGIIPTKADFIGSINNTLETI